MTHSHMKRILPQGLEAKDSDKLLSSIIVPRPIAFVSTLNRDGVPNAACFSNFMGVTPTPPIVAFSIMRRGDQKKDTIRNIETMRDFVINVVDQNLAQAMNMASGSYPPDMSEFDVTGLTPLPSEVVSSPRIAESPIHLECRLNSIVDLGTLPASIVLGEVVCFHVRESLLLDGAIDIQKLNPIGHLSQSTYVRLTDLFTMNRPA